MTVSINSALAVFAGGTGMVVFVLVFRQVLVLNRFRAPVPAWRDQIRTARYVMRYDNALEWRGVKLSERRSLTDELRRNIADAAASDGVRSALERLGHPRDLANAIAARDRGPTWALGSAVAIGLWFALQLGALFGLDVLSTGVQQMAPHNASVVVTTPMLPGTTFDVTTDGAGALDRISVKTNRDNWIVPTVGLLIFSSPWRLLTVRRARRASGASVQK
jgi:hypothetical protein